MTGCRTRRKASRTSDRRSRPTHFLSASVMIEPFDRLADMRTPVQLEQDREIVAPVRRHTSPEARVAEKRTNMQPKRRLARVLAGCVLAGTLFVGIAGPAAAEARKPREPTKQPPRAQTYFCKKGGKKVQATSAAAAAVACRGYGGLR